MYSAVLSGTMRKKEPSRPTSHGQQEHYSQQEQTQRYDSQWGETAQQTRRWTNTGLMLVHRLRRWPNIKPALVERLVFAGR